MKKVAIVGHEPFLSGFASYCLTKNKNSLLNLKKGGVLMLEIDEADKAWTMHAVMADGA